MKRIPTMTGRPRSCRTVIQCNTVVAVVLLVLAGCQTSQQRPGEGPSTSAATDSPDPTTTTTVDFENDTPSLEQIERQFAIGPLTADELGYRIDWRTATGVSDARTLTVQDDSVFLLDGGNFLSRFRVDDGARVWRVPVANPVEEIYGITYVPDNNVVLVTTGGALLELDRASGGLTGRQKLQKIANTAPVRTGQFLVYGSRNGQVIWHSFAVGFQWRATQVAPSIAVPPIIVGGLVAVVGNNGEVMTLSAEHARAIWSTRLLDAVVAPPTMSSEVLYVSGLDQHVRAYDLRNGRPLWKVLTRSPLRESPVLIGHRLYQQIPSDGLVCFDALPLDSPGGKVIWAAEDVTGSVITSHGNDLLTWSDEHDRLEVVDATYGTLSSTMTIAGVQHLICTGLHSGDLYVISSNGTISRLVPKN